MSLKLVGSVLSIGANGPLPTLFFHTLKIGEVKQTETPVAVVLSYVNLTIAPLNLCCLTDPDVSA
jgi:hypothetical protein